MRVPSLGSALLFVVFELVSVPSPAQTLHFHNEFYSRGESFPSIAVGDVNGDGKTDIVAFDKTAQCLDFFPGQGNGKFGSPLCSPGVANNSITLADFNGDGHLDAMTTVNGSAQIYLGDGTGHFSAAMLLTGSSTAIPQTAAVADSIGTGIQMCCLWIPLIKAFIYLGTGTGTFTLASKIQLTGSGAGVAVGDFNRDGKPDFAVANSQDGLLAIVLGNGDGTFAEPVEITQGSFEAISLLAADFNNDGVLDLAVPNLVDSTVSVLIGNGDGTFQDPVTYSIPGNPTQVVAADFNLDGNVDLLATNDTGTTAPMLPGNGDGTFGPATSVTLVSSSYGVATGVFLPAHRPDLAFAESKGMQVLINTSKAQ